MLRATIIAAMTLTSPAGAAVALALLTLATPAVPQAPTPMILTVEAGRPPDPAPTREAVLSALASLAPASANTFAILERTDIAQTYVQTMRLEPDLFQLEHRAGGPEAHVVCMADAETTARAFLLFHATDTALAAVCDWQPLEF